MFCTRFTLLSVVFVVVFIREAESIKCYVCNSNLNPSCGENVHKDKMAGMECSRHYNPPEGGSFICQKIKVEDMEGNGVIMRGCTVQTPDADPCDISSSITRMTDGAAKLKSCDTCAHDLCNI